MKEILEKLDKFYRSRYRGKDFEDKFNNAVEELIETNDISRSEYIKYCISNDIEPTIKRKTPPPSSSSYRSSSC